MQLRTQLILTVLLIGLFTLGSGSISSQERNPQPEGGPIYAAGNGVKVASLIHTVPAVLPDHPDLNDTKHICALVAVVGADGNLKSIIVASKVASPFDHAAIIATERSQFEPGSLKGKPVSTRLLILVPFLGDGNPAVPVVAVLGKGPEALRALTPPVPTYQPEAEFSDEARRTHSGGTVVIQVLVDEDGVPRPIALLAAAGKGLDENALEAVRKYKFKPATFEGVPVACLVNIEVNFRFGSNF